MNELETQPQNRLGAVAFVFGAVAVLAALGMYLGEKDSSNPNNGPALVLLGVGAFLLLVATILASGRRH